MSYRSREDYLKTQRARYRRGTRAQKSRILDEGCAMFGMHRKSLIRALGRPARVAFRRRGPKPHYGPQLLGPLKVVWLAAQQPCSKRLKAALPLWLGPYECRHGTLAPEMRDDLLTMSAATIDRLLRPIRARRRKGLCSTRSARHLEGQIPIRTRFQEVEGPGWFEADTVAHCGSSLAGAFVWSLTLTDIWSGWTENCAVWNRSSRQIVEHIHKIEQGLAFEIEGFDSDNGSEFLNHRLYHYLRDRPVPIEFTRSRPYRKNDNAHVEQKQWTHVRQLLGYDRFEDRRLVARINDLYRNEWRALVNFFLPTMQLIAKHREGTAKADACDATTASHARHTSGLWTARGFPRKARSSCAAKCKVSIHSTCARESKPNCVRSFAPQASKENKEDEPAEPPDTRQLLSLRHAMIRNRPGLWK